MKNLKNISFYTIVIGGFSLLMYCILLKGGSQEAGKVTSFVPQIQGSNLEQFKDTFRHNITHPLAILLLQIITIILVARVFGFICRKIGQPSVVGEIFAGILLGPSFLGTYLPEFTTFLFPLKSLPNLQFLSQIGLILFMFVVGMELDLKVLKNKARDAVVVSHASIIIPFALGVSLAWFIYGEFAPANVKFISFALFLGIAMSMTAFPVLARIVQERGLAKTRLGSLVITCAAADDITAWCLLAAVIAIVKAGSFYSSIYIILMAAGYVAIMTLLVKPFLKKMGDIYSNKEALSKPVVGLFMFLMLLSSYATEVIGIHALFGAFMAGVIMPPNMNFRNLFIEKLEDVALVLLLPLFFVFTGLRTEIGLLNSEHLWKVCGVVIAVAVAGKFIGSALAARFVGQSWRESLSIGALMNTRGLVELVVLNIGYDLGVLGPEIFAILVIMALVTTSMTGPALDLINRFSPWQEPEILDGHEKDGKYKILVSFGSPQRGRSMIKLASSLIRNTAQNASITALHLSPSNELHLYNLEEYERESFEPIRLEAQRLNQPVITLFKPSQDIDKEISETANEGNFDLLLVGIGRTVFEGTLLGRILGFTTKIINPERLYGTITGKEKLFDNTVFDERIRQVLKSARLPVGILIDKDLDRVKKVFVPIFSISDSFLLVYAQKLIHNSGAHISILDATGVVKQNPELREAINAIEKVSPNNVTLYGKNKIEPDLLQQYDLMLIGLDSWRKAVEVHSIWLSHIPSVLIIKP